MVQKPHQISCCAVLYLVTCRCCCTFLLQSCMALHICMITCLCACLKVDKGNYLGMISIRDVVCLCCLGFTCLHFTCVFMT